jgi:AcrR family transcriptional regulator
MAAGPVGRIELARAQAAKARRRRVLSVDAIVDRALRIVDAEGVQAVSMRRVAAEFDTGPASLYAHVANKEELLRLVYDRILEEVEIPSGDTWQDLMRSLAHNLRTALQRHSDAAVLNFAHIPTGGRSLETVERLLGAMISGGVPPQVAAWSLDILSLYIGADVYEGWLLQQRFDDGSGRDPEALGQELVNEVTASFAELPPDRFPYLTANLPVLMVGSSDDRFGFGIDMLIAGFASRISPRPSAPPSETP